MDPRYSSRLTPVLTSVRWPRSRLRSSRLERPQSHLSRCEQGSLRRSNLWKVTPTRCSGELLTEVQRGQKSFHRLDGHGYQRPLNITPGGGYLEVWNRCRHSPSVERRASLGLVQGSYHGKYSHNGRGGCSRVKKLYAEGYSSAAEGVRLLLPWGTN
jgi:hypothetical protein